MSASKVDVHHHVYPPAFTEALHRAGSDPSGWFIPDWTLAVDQAISHAVGTRTTIFSVTAPGPSIEPDSIRAAALARECNEYCARLRDEDPSHYGFFASLPSLLDTRAALAELAYAFDELHADGVVLMTRYGGANQYLGHAAFRPVWAELNRRGAVVLVHPTHPVDTELVNAALPQPMFDYPHETGRAAMDMIVNRTVDATRDCSIVLSHAGGTLPYLIYRAAGMLPYTPMSIGRSTEEIVAAARGFYFDTAISANPVTLKALFAFARPGHVLFGTDFPNAPSEGIKYFTGLLGEYGEVESRDMDDVYWKSAIELFPRLKAYLV